MKEKIVIAIGFLLITVAFFGYLFVDIEQRKSAAAYEAKHGKR